MSTQIQIDLTEYRALLATAFAAKGLAEWVEKTKQEDGVFDFMVESSVKSVKEKFKATGLEE